MAKLTPHVGFFIVALLGVLLMVSPSSLGIVQDLAHAMNDALSDFFALMLGMG